MMEDGRKEAQKTQKWEPDGVRSGRCPAWALPMRASVKRVCLLPASTLPGLLVQAPHPAFQRCTSLCSCTSRQGVAGNG
jgi:hypothetical protein